VSGVVLNKARARDLAGNYRYYSEQYLEAPAPRRAPSQNGTAPSWQPIGEVKSASKR
jgi:hypothetical protein